LPDQYRTFHSGAPNRVQVRNLMIMIVKGKLKPTPHSVRLLAETF
jgi:hypothetical protein